MLVLARRKGESFQIGKHIKIVVTRLSEKKVRLAIDAPRSETIVRTELLERKKHAVGVNHSRRPLRVD